MVPTDASEGQQGRGSAKKPGSPSLLGSAEKDLQLKSEVESKTT